MRRVLVPAALLFAACGTGNNVDPMPDMAPIENTLGFKLQPFTLQPGEEKIECYYVPPDGKEKFFNRITVDMAAGSHHLVVFRVTDQGEPAYGPRDCINGEMPSFSTLTGMLPGSQQPHTEYNFPEGVGMKIAANEGVWFQSHYINATAQPMTTDVTWKVSLVEASKVPQLAGLIFYSNYNLSVPPGMSKSEMNCKAPMDMNLLTATGHMHKRGIDFVATVNGDPLFHTTDWSEPNGAVFPLPGVAVKTGDSIYFACTYNNTSNNTYTFGNSAEHNEMCILPALYYPSADGATLFFCQK